MIQRCRRGPLGRGPLSLTATAILLRENRNRDSLLQFPVQQALLFAELFPIEISFRDSARCPRHPDPVRRRLYQPRDTLGEALRFVGDPYARAMFQAQS